MVLPVPSAKGASKHLLLTCLIVVAVIAVGFAAVLAVTSRGNGDRASNGSNSLRASTAADVIPFKTTAPIMPMPTASPILLDAISSPAPTSATTGCTTSTNSPTEPGALLAQQSKETPVPSSAAANTTLQPTARDPTVSPSLAPRRTAFPSSLSNRPTVLLDSPTTATAPIQHPAAITFGTMSPVEKPIDAPTLPPLEFPAFNEEETTFRLKLYWQEGYFWQEETRERFWCIECTQCETLNFSADGAGCDYAWECQAGHQLWLHSCQKGYGHVFQAVRVFVAADNDSENSTNSNQDNYYHQINVHGTNLCLERTPKRYLTVQECNANDDAQWWHPIRADGGPFELRPAALSTTNNADGPSPSYCVTQQHHPKPYEILGFQKCQQAHRWETGYWSTFPLYSANENDETN